MDIPTLHLPLDRYGTAESHHKVERYELKEGDLGIVFPNDGPFFTHTVDVYDADNNLLKPIIDWEPIIPSQEASMEVAQEIHHAIVVRKQNVDVVKFDRQLVGGKYTNAAATFEDIVKLYKENQTHLPWDQVILPESGVDARHHVHHTDDFKGTQDVCAALLTVNETLIKSLLDKSDATINNNVSRLNEHDEHLANHDDAIARLNSNYAFLNSDFRGLEDEISRVEKVLKDDANTKAYDLTVLNNSGTVIRRHQCTVIDKLAAQSSIITVDWETFKPADTLIINSALDGSFGTDIDFNGASFVDESGKEKDFVYLSGRFSLKLRYLGQRTFQMLL